MRNWLVKNRSIGVVLTLVFVLRVPAMIDGFPAVYDPTEYFLSKIALSRSTRFSPDPFLCIYLPLSDHLPEYLYGGFSVSDFWHNGPKLAMYHIEKSGVFGE